MVRSFSMTSRTTCSLNSSEYLAAGMVSILSTHGKKNSPSPRNTTHPTGRDPDPGQNPDQPQPGRPGLLRPPRYLQRPHRSHQRTPGSTYAASPWASAISPTIPSAVSSTPDASKTTWQQSPKPGDKPRLQHPQIRRAGMAGSVASVSRETMKTLAAMKIRLRRLRCALCAPRQGWYYGDAVQSGDGNVFRSRSDDGFDDGCRRPEGS